MPVFALVVIMLVVMLFICVGDVNSLAPVVTTAFMLTYAAIDYSYFALAMSYDKRQEREAKWVFFFLLNFFYQILLFHCFCLFHFFWGGGGALPVPETSEQNQLIAVICPVFIHFS